ncbi:MAG TPA: hypothetical protein VH393_09600, partial [Ktedonobacterales bacterium]
MKRTVLILSLVAPILMFVIGGFFFAASGFGIDFEAPPTSPQRIVGALIGYIPGLVLALIALALSLSTTARSRQTGWFVGLLVWPVVPVVAAALMLTGVVGLSDNWWLAAVFLPLSTLLYGAIGPAPLVEARPQGSPESTSPAAPFFAFVGILALVTVLGFTTLVRGALPFSTPPAATPTIGPAVLSVRVGDGAANCATGSYPTVTITNTTQQTVGWSASVNGAGVTVTPASGR